MHNQLQNIAMGTVLSLVGLVLVANVNAVQAQSTPSLDPTYGFPTPKRTSEAKRVPDAAWAWTERPANDQTIYARRRFRLSRIPQKAMVYITVDDEFAAYVNGKKIGQTPSVPGDNELWKKVQIIDVTAQLRQGENVIAIQAHNNGDAAGFAVRLEADAKLILTSDKSWKVSEEPPTGDWTEPTFDDATWAFATEEGRVGEGPWGDGLQGWPVPLSAIPSYLSHLSIAPVRWAYAGDPDGMNWHTTSGQMSIKRPAGEVDGKGWRVVLDFGKELTGRVLTEGSTPGLTLGTGESTGEVLDKPWTSTSGFATPYTALRYVTVTVPPQKSLITLKARMDHLYYPVRYRGSFDCSDPLLTKVWYTGAYTAHLCMQDDIWDAPKRDRWRWMGDLHVAGEVINNVFADRFLMEQTMARLRQDVQGGRSAGDLPLAHINGIPGYSYSWISGLADFYRHIGDKAYLQSQHDGLVSMLEFCRQDLDEEGNFANKHNAWVFVDWSPEFGNDSPVARATTQLFLFKALNEGAFLLKELGDETNATKYKALAERVGRAAQDHLLSPNGTFGNRKQENAMAIYAGVATPNQAVRIFESGIFKPETEPTNLIVSPYYGNYVLYAMGIADRTQDGLDYVRSFWGQMVKDGATTFYEHYGPTWDKRNFHAHLQWDERNNPAAGYHVSLCHGWSAGATTFLTEYVLGVRPTGVGFKTFTVSPRLGDLDWVSGVIPTPNGDISVRMDRKSKGLTVIVKIPKGTTALIALPSAISTVNDKPSHGSLVRVGAGTFKVVGD
jgi:alpha-L-rhamnosidase